jgi:enoyl-CoA hydratase/carnithine racemase
MKTKTNGTEGKLQTNNPNDFIMDTFTRFTLDSSIPALWRVTFNNPPINLIDSVMIDELRKLFSEVESGKGPNVLLFDSADPDYFLAHYDITSANRSLVDSLPPGPTGFHPWIDLLIRLSKLPAVTISAIRGRARGAGSEFVLSCDIRFASRERAVVGQFEVGFGAIPGGGPATRLPGLVGRGRAFEILLGGEDFDGSLAERYGYVNRAIPDIEFEGFVDRFVRRVSTFDTKALGDIKHFINKVSLPVDEEFPPQLDAFWQAAARPAFQARHNKAFEDGYQQRSDVELHLGKYIEQLTKVK